MKVESERFKQDRLWLLVVGALLTGFLGVTNFLAIPKEVTEVIDLKGNGVITELDTIKRNALNTEKDINNILLGVQQNSLTTLDSRIDDLETQVTTLNLGTNFIISNSGGCPAGWSLLGAIDMLALNTVVKTQNFSQHFNAGKDFTPERTFFDASLYKKD